MFIKTQFDYLVYFHYKPNIKCAEGTDSNIMWRRLSTVNRFFVDNAVVYLTLHIITVLTYLLKRRESQNELQKIVS